MSYHVLLSQHIVNHKDYAPGVPFQVWIPIISIVSSRLIIRFYGSNPNAYGEISPVIHWEMQYNQHRTKHENRVYSSGFTALQINV